MKPGSMVKIRRFDEKQFIGVYLGPSVKFDVDRKRYEGRFILTTGIIKDIDLQNSLVWNIEVLK